MIVSAVVMVLSSAIWCGWLVRVSANGFSMKVLVSIILLDMVVLMMLRTVLRVTVSANAFMVVG